MAKTAKTPEQLEALKQRVAGFNAKLKEILGEYNLAITAVPFILPDGTINARVQVIDIDDIEKVEPDANPEGAPVSSEV